VAEKYHKTSNTAPSFYQNKWPRNPSLQ